MTMVCHWKILWDKYLLYVNTRSLIPNTLLASGDSSAMTDGMSLVDDAARQIVGREIDGLRGYQRDKIKGGDPWTKQLYELEGQKFLKPESVNLNYLWQMETVDSYIEKFERKKHKIGTMMILGPDFYDDSEDEDSEPPCVPDRNVEKLLKSISSMDMPNLRHLTIDNSFHSDCRDNILLFPPYLIWLLSGGIKFKSLSVANLFVLRQSDLEEIANAFSSCTSMQELTIDFVFARGVETVEPLMRVLAGLPRLKTIRIIFEAQESFGGGSREDHLGHYIEQALPILQFAMDGVTVKQVKRFYNHMCPELSNRA